jgi:uncharacterized protein
VFILNLSLLTIFGFISGSIDAVIGGGNLIIIALLTLIGFSPLKAIVTTQVIALIQCLTATFLYSKTKLINWKQAIFFATFAAIGSVIGATLLFQTTPELLNYIAGSLMVLMLIIMPQFDKNDGPQILGLLSNFYNRLLNKRPVVTNNPKTKIVLGIVSLFLGIYGGFYGAGRGLIMVLVFYLLGDAKLQNTTANIKPADAVMSIIPIFFFLKIKNVIGFELLIPLTTSSIAGSLAGVKFGPQVKTKYLRIILYGITLISAVKLLYFS